MCPHVICSVKGGPHLTEWPPPVRLLLATCTRGPRGAASLPVPVEPSWLGFPHPCPVQVDQVNPAGTPGVNLHVVTQG
jgi:hypothetical protein